ncbi:hypothetical protein CVV43_05440 [Candidatus Saccharibacteria bacterium HGW-Saccharibacteria-1]|jgi:SagB-type dehydrogenase family enzyme|nr:MAG: hypothetical protein CVV43_05440 [Candidatus Saccharibacteria bacterium HGW-Saccharibacteria-1]
MIDDESFYDIFWDNTNLSRLNMAQFANQISLYQPEYKEQMLEYPDKPNLLPLPKSKINKITKNRVSDRDFTDKVMTKKELGLIFSSFYAWNSLEHRSYPSAGATYSLEIFCISYNTEILNNKILYYDAENHGLSSTNNSAPSWKESTEPLNYNNEISPNLLVIYVIFPSRVTNKYGDRGGRFALLEAGAAMQQLSLQIAESNVLKGVVLGGLMDDFWKSKLGLKDTDAQIACGFLIGK